MTSGTPSVAALRGVPKVASVKICEACKESFAPRSNRQRWCASRCAAYARRTKSCRNPDCDRMTVNGRDCPRCAARLSRWGTYERTWREKRPIVSPDGYTRRWLGREHPEANAQGYAYEHRLVIAEVLGRALLKTETVHHRNGVKTDNRADNLELWTKNHGSGVRVEDLVAHVVQHYKWAVLAALAVASTPDHPHAGEAA